MATCNFGNCESGGHSLTISAILISVLLRTASFSASIMELEYSRQAGFGFLTIFLDKGEMRNWDVKLDGMSRLYL